MRIAFLDLKRQYGSIKTEIDNAIAEVINDAAFIGGPYVESFEHAFAAFCNTKHCLGVANGTDALYLALRTLNIGRGDEVITAANSFIATSEAITMAGAKVVFVDIDPVTYSINVDKIGEKITPRTKAIIPVHLYGQPADMDPILDLARRHHLAVIEDAAQAHGAIYKGRRIGTLGDIACFSFYPGKNLGAYGDGGALVTNDEGWVHKARMIANHGRRDKYDHETEGVNSRLDGMQAAILHVKLRHLSEWNENRRKNAVLYNGLLHDTGVIAPVEIGGATAVYHLYVVRVRNGRRQKLQEHLRSRGIDTGIHYPIALPHLKAYAHLGHTARDFPEATRASQEILSLPMFPELEKPQIEYIAREISEFSAHFTEPDRTA